MAPTFVTLKSVGVHNVSETFSYAPCTPPQLLHTLSWEWHSRKRVLNGIAARVGREEDAGRSIRSRHRTRPLWQLDDNYDHSSADAQQPAAQVGTETQALHRPGKADSEHGKLTPRDPNIVGFVPAYILGNVYLCKLPDSTDHQVKEGKLEESTDSTEPPNRSQAPRAAHLSLLLAMGSMGAAAGLVGLFASKAAAQQVARQAYKQIQPAAPDMPATESAPAGNPIANTLQRAARGVAGRAASLLQLKPGSKQGEEDSEDAEMRSSMRDAISRAETAMAQAEGILKQLDQAAEELFMKELSVMPMPLALALDLVMGHPSSVRLLGPPLKGKAKAQTASKQKHKGQGDQAGDASVLPGMVTYTIPGIAFGMPSSVGPLHFAPVFTSRHTAEIAWDVVCEMLILRHVQKRKLRRHIKRQITEMSAAHLTGLQSRVETQEANEVEEGMSEPAEVADFLNELGESDNRPSKNKTRFRPRGPLDLMGALACGVVSLYARTVAWGGDAADEVLFHSPIGQRAIGMSGDQQQTQQRPSLEQQQQQQQAEVQEGQQKVHEVAAQTPGAGQVLRMPPSLPTTDDLRCVLGCGERLTMLDGLQGTLAGLAVKVLTGPGLGDKVESPFEIPIYSLKGAQTGTPLEDSMADGTTASVHFDLPLATGRKKTAAKDKNKKSNSAESVGQGLVLVGDIGFEKYKTASDYLKAKKQSNQGRFSEASVGFGNLSAIASILEQQQDEQGKL
ncbi:hypothetical protein WJX82_001939 [Trebouxia sp. C0006]